MCAIGGAIGVSAHYHRENSLITAIKRDLRCQIAPRGIATALIAVIGVALREQSKSIRTIPCNSYIRYIFATGYREVVPPHLLALT